MIRMWGVQFLSCEVRFKEDMEQLAGEGSDGDPPSDNHKMGGDTTPGKYQQGNGSMMANTTEDHLLLDGAN